MLGARGARMALQRAVVENLFKDGSKRLAVGPLQTQVATVSMKATHGEKYPYAKPWPYERKKFRLWQEFFDNTKARLNENSRVICVEGNVGIGKSEFAKRLCKEFDLKFFDEVKPDELFKFNGYDIRELDSLLPPDARAYDLKRFLADDRPQDGKVARLLHPWYILKYQRYCEALCHLLSTGQGVVVVRSPFSDRVFIDASRKMGWITKEFTDFYYDIRHPTIKEILTPHLTIFLDAPISMIRKNINKRNDPKEVNSPLFSDEYFEAIDSAYKRTFLPDMRTNGEVLEIEWSTPADQIDMELIAEEIATLDLDRESIEDPMFHDWTVMDEEELCYRRRLYQNFHRMYSLFQRPIPFECPEMLLSADDTVEYSRIVQNHPALKWKKGWSPELGHDVFLKL